MPTEKQIEASRQNGAKSRGPVTPEGKRNSARNSTKHGILAKAVVIKGESEEAFINFCADLFDEFEPATTFEETLIQKMAVAQWRLERLWHIETTTFERQIDREKEKNPALRDAELLDSAAFETLSNGETRTLDLIARYQSSLDRQYLRAHKRFLECRNARLKAGPPSPPPTPGPNVVSIDTVPPSPESENEKRTQQLAENNGVADSLAVCDSDKPSQIDFDPANPESPAPISPN